MIILFVYLGIGAFLLLISLKGLAEKTISIIKRENLKGLLGFIFVLMVSLYTVICLVVIWPVSVVSTLKRRKNGD